jgi:hypothetical protein
VLRVLYYPRIQNINSRSININRSQMFGVRECKEAKDSFNLLDASEF